MGYLLVVMVVAYALIIVGLVTVLLYYASLAYQCDALVGFWCHTDWKCADVDGNNNDVKAASLGIQSDEPSPGTYNASGQLIPGDKIGCHLKGLYGVDLTNDPDCKGYPTRVINPCMPLVSPGDDRNDPNSYTGQVSPTAYPCDQASAVNGLCSGKYNTSGKAGEVNNITDYPVINESNTPGASQNPQYGLGASPPLNDPFGCACHFGTNVIANSGTDAATTPINSSYEGGGVYNISANACSQIINAYKPKQ